MPENNVPENNVPENDVITSVDALLELLAAGAGQHDAPHASGHEAVDLLAHGLQCAERLAKWHPDDIELQVAGLIHDIGHQLRPGDDAGHGVIAAEAVRGLLGDRVARLIIHHVPAKRYLVTIDPAYMGKLSSVSIETLAHQGGPMTAAEMLEAEAQQDWTGGLELRRADEAAKSPGRVVPGLNHWAPVIRRVAAWQITSGKP